MKSLWKSFRDAFAGLYFCLKTQRNMVIHSVVGLLVIAAGIGLKVGTAEQLFLISAVFLVIILETVNTAIERAVDLAGKSFNHVAHTAKDVSAAAVLLGSLYAVLVGIIIFGPYLLKIWF